MASLLFCVFSTLERMCGFIFLSALIGTDYTTAKYRDIRLTGDENLHKGALNILTDINWGTVCGNDWSKVNRDVACRHLGFPNASSIAVDGGRFHYVGSDMWLSDVQCNGDETYIWDCPHSERANCDRTQQIGLICNVPGYIGCYGNNATDWVLDAAHFRSKALTIQRCLKFCKKQNFPLAGLEKDDCYCGYEHDIYHRLGQYDDNECHNVCTGSRDDACGGVNKISIYNVSSSFCTDLDPPVGSWYRGESTFFGDSLTFGCNNGVELIGNDVIRCILGDEPHEVRWSAPVPYCFGVTTGPTPARANGDFKPPNNSLLQENGVLIWSIAGVAGFFLIVTLLTVIMTARSTKKRNSGDPEEHSIDFDLEPAGATGTYRHSLHSLHLLDTVKDNKENVNQEQGDKTAMYLREEMKQGVGMQTNALTIIPLKDEDDLEWDEDIELDSEREIDPRTSSIEHVGRTVL